MCESILLKRDGEGFAPPCSCRLAPAASARSLDREALFDVFYPSCFIPPSMFFILLASFHLARCGHFCSMKFNSMPHR